MALFSGIAKSSGIQCLKKSDSNPSQLLFHLNSLQWRFQTIRTLLLQSASDSVQLHKLSDSDSGIVEVKLDRPEAKNAIGKEMLRGLQNTFEAVSEDNSAKVMVICSAVKKVFCAGADLKERKSMSSYEVQDFVNTLRSTFSFLEAIRIPTIAAVEGAALGGGLEMALSCDLRICGEDAVFGLPETGLAIIPGAGGTQRLPRLVGRSVAKELIFTGRKFDSKEAVTLGVVNHCVPAGSARSKALEIARDICQKSMWCLLQMSFSAINVVSLTNVIQGSCKTRTAVPTGPLAIRMAKQAIDGGLEMDIASALSLEMECYGQLLNTQDRLEGLAAFAEKRKPFYKGE